MGLSRHSCEGPIPRQRFWHGGLRRARVSSDIFPISDLCYKTKSESTAKFKRDASWTGQFPARFRSLQDRVFHPGPSEPGRIGVLSQLLGRIIRTSLQVTLQEMRLLFELL
jgi:hypothetical protein